MRHLALACTLLTLLPTGVEAVTRGMFVTSVSGQGNLGSWPDAGSATGLAAGDAICRARAAAAGLDRPNNYVAWLSTSTTDAYCRIHGLSGKRSANCGEANLPAAAGPWQRVDGLPFGAGITQLLNPHLKVFLPPRIDENGNSVHDEIWTGTGDLGEFSSPACSSWTSIGGFGTKGSSDHTGANWAIFGELACSGSLRLACLEMDAGDALPTVSNWGRLAFVTSASGAGDLGSWPEAGTETGLDAGDAICRNLAAGAGLAHASSFKAWLSTGSMDARDRFASDGPFIRPDRLRVATDIADLTDGFLHSPVNFNEEGDYIGNFVVWTGTTADGLADTNRCDNWTSAATSASGSAGRADAADADWTASSSATCDYDSARLYCLQDLPLVFGDGFESHDTTDWSSAQP